MAPLLQNRSDQRAAILTEIGTYEGTTNRRTVPLAALQSLLASVKSYMEGEANRDDFKDSDGARSYIDLEGSEEEFGNVEDEDLMLAETTETTITGSTTKRTVPIDFDDAASPKKLKVPEDSIAVELAESILQRTWGFPHFRLKQQQAISRLITGGSAVVVFPTGGGKSLVYQIPALAFDFYDKQCGQDPGGGVTLVVSPLIALMKVCGRSFTYHATARKCVLYYAASG